MCSVSSASLFLFFPQYLSHHSWQCRHCQGIHEVVLLSLSCALLCGDLLHHLEIEVEEHSLGLWSCSKFRTSLIYTIAILEYFRWMSACWLFHALGLLLWSDSLAGCIHWDVIYLLSEGGETEITGELSGWERKKPATALKMQHRKLSSSALQGLGERTQQDWH